MSTPTFIAWLFVGAVAVGFIILEVGKIVAEWCKRGPR